MKRWKKLNHREPELKRTQGDDQNAEENRHGTIPYDLSCGTHDAGLPRTHSIPAASVQEGLPKFPAIVALLPETHCRCFGAFKGIQVSLKKLVFQVFVKMFKRWICAADAKFVRSEGWRVDNREQVAYSVLYLSNRKYQLFMRERWAVHFALILFF